MAELTKRYSRILFQKSQSNLVSEPFYVGNNKVAVSAYSGGSGLPPGARITFQEVVFIDGGRTDGTICTPGFMNNSQQYDYKPYVTCGCEPALSERMSYLEFDRQGWYRAVYTGPSRASVMVSAIETAQEAKSSNCSAPCCPIDVDLVIDKAVSSKVITAGAPGSFTLTVTNKGPEASVGGSVMDQLPAGLTYGIPTAVYTGGATGSQPSLAELPAGDWHYTLLPVGGKIVITIPFVADGPGSFVPDNNQATVFAGPKERETNFGNNTDNVFFVVVKPTGDVWITKAVAQGDLKEGDTFTYTVTVGNTGPDSAGGSIIKDDVPNGLVIGSITAAYSGGASGPQPTAAQLAAGYVVPTLPAGGQVVLTVTGVAPKAGYYLNFASVKPPASISDSDPNNNSASVPITVTGKTVDLSVTKKADKEAYAIGETVTYTINFANAGPSDANGAVIKDVIPASLTGVSVSTTYAGGAGTGTPTPAQLAAGWIVATLPAGGSGILTVTGITTVAGVFTNAVNITAPAGRVDTNSGNNNALVVISVNANCETHLLDCAGATVPCGTKVLKVGDIKDCAGNTLACDAKVFSKGDLNKCVNGVVVPLDCGDIVKVITCPEPSPCPVTMTYTNPSASSSAGGCVEIGNLGYVDGIAVYQSRDNSMVVGSTGGNNVGGTGILQRSYTNTETCPVLVEWELTVQDMVNVYSPNTGVTFIHLISNNLGDMPVGGGGYSAGIKDNQIYNNVAYTGNDSNPVGGISWGFPVSGSSQTAGKATWVEQLAVGQTSTVYCQWWAVLNQNNGPLYLLHASSVLRRKVYIGGRLV
jgi:uncharacterized repeat protein (TIGR01451 family)